MTANEQQGFDPARFFINEVEFREEIIYFIIVDRFFDASSDEEERAGVWDRGEQSGLYDKTWLEWGKYWGGNLRGIIDKIPYLKTLGITAVWLSPLFEQVDDMQFDRAPMHGYWTKDFKRINPRFLPLDDSNSLKRSRTLKGLVDAFHAAGIKLILDVVCNHSSPDINGVKGRVYDDDNLLADFYDDQNRFYHHYPEITDWEDEFQLVHYEMLGLATFNEQNPTYRAYMRQAVKEWIDVGVDALRIDTLKHMPLWFWQEFTTDMKTHKPDIFMFGEYGFGKPWDPRTVAYANQSGMSILDFGLCDAIRFSFSGEQPGGFHLIESLLAFDQVYRRANELVTFIDNHDMPRFLSVVSDPRMLELAVVLLFSLRGVPCLFYGTEQYLHNDTDGGHDPYNRPMMDRWDTGAPLAIMIASLCELRRQNQAISFGSHQQRYLTESVYAFSRSYRDHRLLTIINKADQVAPLQDLFTNLPAGDHDCVLTNRTIRVNTDGLASLTIAPQEALIFSVVGHRIHAPVVGVFQLNGFTTQPGQSLALVGDCEELGGWDFAKGYGMEYVNQNTWICEVPFGSSVGSLINYKFFVVNHRSHFQDSRYLVENITARRFVLPPKGRVKFDCRWED